MKIAVLSQNPELYSTRRLVEAGEKRGHEMHVVDPLKCYMNITAHQPSIFYEGEKLQGFEAVIPRIGTSITFFGTAVLRQFEAMDVYSVNSSIAINRARDKLRSLQILARKGIPLPLTGFSHATESSKSLMDIIGGAPLVIKLIEGTQGRGVVLADTNEAAESVIDAFRSLRADLLVQKFVREGKGRDVRCFVVGGKVVAAMVRQAKDGDFRSNLHRGGTAFQAKISPEERSIAVNATQCMGLNKAGVDLLRSEQGPLVIEVNSSPGLEGIETVTKKDVSGSIIEFVEKNKDKKNRKGKSWG